VGGPPRLIGSLVHPGQFVPAYSSHCAAHAQERIVSYRRSAHESQPMHTSHLNPAAGYSPNQRLSLARAHARLRRATAVPVRPGRVIGTFFTPRHRGRQRFGPARRPPPSRSRLVMATYVIRALDRWIMSVTMTALWQVIWPSAIRRWASTVLSTRVVSRAQSPGCACPRSVRRRNAHKPWRYCANPCVLSKVW